MNDIEEFNESNEAPNGMVKLPLWRRCMEQMQAENYTYGSKWPAEYFERLLRAKRDQTAFIFQMIALRQAVLAEDGYYIQSTENGAFYEIPSAEAHNDVGISFMDKQKRLGVRAVRIFDATLRNPNADLSDDVKRDMEGNLERAQKRYVLLAREKHFTTTLDQMEPGWHQRKKTAK